MRTLRTDLSVAVIDTGLVAGRFDRSVLPGVNLSGEGEPDDPLDGGRHGTDVAATVLRVCPAARLIPVKIMERRGVLRDLRVVETAFEWVRERRAALGIQVVCAAFADSSHEVSDAAYRGSRVQKLIAALREEGVLTVAAAGNWFPEHGRRHPQGMAWPAILREVVSAGALEEVAGGPRLTRTTQRLHADAGTGCHTTAFVEPAGLGETSGAAAVIAGCLAALREAHPDAPADELVRLLLRHRLEARDEAGLAWPAVRVCDVLSAP